MKAILILTAMLAATSCSLFKKDDPKPEPTATATSNPGWVPAECNKDPACGESMCMCVQDKTCHTAEKCHKRP